MQLKVIYNKESHTFWVNRKVDPLQKLLKLAIEKFDLASLGEQNCRLRSYNIVNGLMQDTYSGQELRTFDDLKIYPLKTLALETKLEHESFEDYDPNLINLKINVWGKGITTLNEEAL